MFDRIITVKRTRYYWVETVAGLAVLVIINALFFPKSPGYLGIDPNPLWIVVIGIAARYGRNGALFAGIASAVVFASYLISFGGMDIFYDDLWLLRFPFLFILVGFLIGEIKTVFILREDYLTNRIEELKNLNDKLSQENSILREAHKDLTIDVATKQDTITVLNEITGRLKSTDPAQIYNGVLSSLKENMEIEECSLYVMEGDVLRLFRSVGWKEYYKRPRTYRLGEGLVGLAAKKRRTVSIKDYLLKRHVAEETSDMIGDSILALPIVGLENNVYGVASIEKMSLLSLTESSIQTANVICDLAASSLNNAYAFKDLGEKQIRDERYDIFKYHYFISRAKEEFLRSSNYMIPLSTVAFKWPRLASLPDNKKVPLLESVITLIRSSLRAFDVLAIGPTEEFPLVLLLATTSGAQAKALIDKLITHMKDYGLDKVVSDEPVEGTAILSAFDPNTMSSADDLLRPLGIL